MNKNYRKHIVFFIVLINASLFTKAQQILVKHNYSSHDLITKLLLSDNSGLLIENVVYTGNSKSIGAFFSNSDKLPISNGIVLSTGLVDNIDGPNESPRTGFANHYLGNNLLENIVKSTIEDAAVLEFIFYSSTTKISFNYFFASEEYPEFVDKGVNDVFAFFIEGEGYDEPKNIALIPGTKDAVTVDNINDKKNAQYYISNPVWYNEMVFDKLDKVELSRAFSFDGLTVMLTANADVIPYKLYKLTIAIADVGDNLYDSGVFLKSKSFQSKGDTIPFMELIKSDFDKLLLDDNLFDFEQSDTCTHLATNIEFEFDSYDILESNYFKLNKLVVLFTQYFDVSVKIIGYTDNQGTQQYNKVLSYKRANAIKKYFTDKGLAANRFQVEGRGKLSSADSTSTSEEKAKSRRVEFILY